MLAANTTLQKRYRILRELGHGGMGTVYEALDQRLNCIVALKKTTAASDSETRLAFEREAALLANLRHSALPKVMDYFSEGDGDFLVMEFIPGYDLRELLELRGSPFPQRQVMRWADDLLKVLEYLHGQQPPILHRDIKPSNLKLTKQGEIFLLDFGLAKGRAGQMQTLATSRSIRGYTPVYSSLEQIHGHGTDQRSDLYSLAATLYHLLTGTTPVDAPRRFSVIEDEQPDPLLPIEKVNPEVSPQVAEVVHRGMNLNRRQRPASATEMRRALRNALDEEEQSAAEQEYRRAEEKRKLLDENRKETLEPPIEELHESETLKFAEQIESTQLPPEPEPVATAVPPTVRLQQQPIVDDSSPIKTLKATTPDLRVQMQAPQRAEIGPAQSSRSNRTLVLATAGVFVAVLAVLLVWFINRDSGESLASAETTKTSSSNLELSATGQPTPPEGMVYVPGGDFMMGRNAASDEAERPAHPQKVQPFYLDIYEVTNEDYEKFVKATNHRPPPTWVNDTYPAGDARKPVTGVNWDDATAYTKWANKRLPTEQEWEFAARGSDERRYPWGNAWQSGSANADNGGRSLAEVGSFKGASPFGAFDMVGNAWEWTASDFRAYPKGRLPRNLPAGTLKVIRGGSYESTKDYATTTYRTGWPSRGAQTYAQTGFRCAKDVEK